MMDFPQFPSRRLRLVAFAARWLLGLVLAFWLSLLLGWAVLHVWIVPRIGDYRPQLEQRASQWLGVPVKIGEIRVESEGLLPAFELRDIALFDPQGQVALRLARIQASLSPRSLLHLGFEQLSLDRPELDVRRTADGRLLIAGLNFGGSNHRDSGVQRWFFAQPEFVIQGGSLRWTDDTRQAAPVALSAVNLLVRNRGRSHKLHLDGELPAHWGRHFSLNARFTQPFLARSTGDWRDWDGQVFADFAEVDVAQLRDYADLGLDLRSGHGALRLWADLRRGELLGATADLALTEVSASLRAGSEPLTLRSVTGRLGGSRSAKGFALRTENLQFQLADGRRWPGGNLAVQWNNADARNPGRGELHADHLDLAAVALMANQLPLDDAQRERLRALAPQGLMERLDGHWSGNAPSAGPYDFQGRVSALQLAAGPAGAAPAPVNGSVRPPHPGRPGISGATLDFTLNQDGGKASLLLQNGSLSFPGVFEEPRVPIDRLASNLSWQRQGERISVRADNLHFANPDAEGEAQLSWHSSDPASSSSHARFPGVLDLQGRLSRAAAPRVHRYLPLLLPAEVRSYVQAAVQQGQSNSVKFRVKGDLWDLPFRDPRLGEFQISAVVQNAQYAFIPREIGAVHAPQGEWPALTQLNGQLLIDRVSLQVRDASGSVEGLDGLSISHTSVQIDDLAHPVVQVNGEARGPAQRLLQLISASPLADWTAHALDPSSASGNVDCKLRLNLPLADLNKSRVQGSVSWSDNDFRLSPSLPLFGRSKGQLSFSNSGFALQGVQASLLGGELRLDGGTPRGPQRGGEPSLQFQAQGSFSAEGLRQAPELGLLSRLAQHASGAAAFSATLALRRGQPEFTLQSNLQGLALDLPAPLRKGADSLLALRVENSLLAGDEVAPAPLRDQLSVVVGTLGSVRYERDRSGPEPRVLRGAIALGLSPGETMPMPERGVAANLQLDRFDADAWDAVLSTISTKKIANNSVSKPSSAIISSEQASHGEADNAYLPNVIALRAQELRVDGHSLNQVVVGGTREGRTWRANMDAHELSGYLEYRQSSGSNPGRVYARLERLIIAPARSAEVEEILDQQPSSIPALDIVVEDLDLRGKKLGRVEVDAVNQTSAGSTRREWRLNKLKLTVPEASFSATGEWAEPVPLTPRAARRTAMDFQLDISDAGALLTRLGMNDLVRRGKGRFEGRVTWNGSPLALDLPTLGGQFKVDVANGQFLKADLGRAKLLGVLSLQSLPRRLTLDFRDLFSEGFAFDFVRGDVHIEQGIASTNNLQMKGVNAAVLMDGHADILHETQDLKVVVVPEINAGTASLVATAINPLIGLSTFLTQMLLRRPLMEAATRDFHITGAWTDPKIEPIAHPLPAAEPKAQPAR